jgi:hypothetical protein
MAAAPTLGIYDTLATSTVPVSSYQQRLTNIAAMGFRMVLPYGALATSVKSFLTYLDIAATLGVSVALDFHGTPWYTGTSMVSAYPTWAASVGATTTNTDFITRSVQAVMAHPGLWGYYVGDEPAPSYHSQVLTYASLVRSTDATHPRLIVASVQGGINTGGTNYVTTYAQPYHDCCEVLAGDYYPFGYYATYPGLPGWGATCQALQTVWNTYSLSGGLVLQSFPYTNYASHYAPNYPCSPWPTCGSFPRSSEMRAQYAIALASCTPAVVLYYSYFDLLTSGALDDGSTSTALANIVTTQMARQHT